VQEKQCVTEQQTTYETTYAEECVSAPSQVIFLPVLKGFEGQKTNSNTHLI
jgi:hypothetical protein